MSRHTFLKSPPSLRMEPRSPSSTFLNGHIPGSHQMTATSGLLARAKHKYLQNIEDTTHNLPTSPQQLSSRYEGPELCSTSGSTLSRTQSSAFRKKGNGYSERASSSRAKGYSNMFLTSEKQMVGESLASRQNWKKKKELRQYRQEAAKLLVIRIYKLFAKHFDSLKLFAHQSMLEGYRGQKHLSERLRDAKQKGKTIRTQGETAVLESHHFDPIKSGRKLLREQSLQELRKRMRLGLPLKSIEPEHVGSPVNYTRMMSARRFKQEVLSDRSHYVNSKENNPHSSNSSRFMQTFDNSGLTSKGKNSRRQTKIEEGIIRRSMNKYSDLHINRKPHNQILKSPEPQRQHSQRGEKGVSSISRTSSCNGKYLKLKQKDLLDQASIRPPLQELGAYPIEEIPVNELETPLSMIEATSESCLLSGKKAAVTAGFLRTIDMMHSRMKLRRLTEGMQSFKENAVLRISIERALLIFKTVRQRFLKRMLITLFRTKASSRFMMGLHQNTGTFGQCSMNLSPSSSDALADIAMAARQSLSQVIESKLWGDQDNQRNQKVSMFNTNDTSRRSIQDFKSFMKVQKVFKRSDQSAKRAELQPKAALFLFNRLTAILLRREKEVMKRLRGRQNQCQNFKELRAITLQTNLVMLFKRHSAFYFSRWKVETKLMNLMKQRRAALLTKLLGLNQKRGGSLAQLQAINIWSRNINELKNLERVLLNFIKAARKIAKRATFKNWWNSLIKAKQIRRCVRHKESSLKQQLLAKFKTETIRSLKSTTKQGLAQNRKRAVIKIIKLCLRFSAQQKWLQHWKEVCLKSMKLAQRKAIQHTLKNEIALSSLRRFCEKKSILLKKQGLAKIRDHKLGKIKGRIAIQVDFKRKARQMGEVLKNIHHSRALRQREAFVRLMMFAEKRETLTKLKLDVRRNTLDTRRDLQNIAPSSHKNMLSLSPDGQMLEKGAYFAQFQKKKGVPFGESKRGIIKDSMNRVKKSSKAFNRYA